MNKVISKDGTPIAFDKIEQGSALILAEHRYVYIVQQPEHVGHVRHTLFVDDLDALIARIAERRLRPLEAINLLKQGVQDPVLRSRRKRVWVRRCSTLTRF